MKKNVKRCFSILLSFSILFLSAGEALAANYQKTINSKKVSLNQLEIQKERMLSDVYKQLVIQGKTNHFDRYKKILEERFKTRGNNVKGIMAANSSIYAPNGVSMSYRLSSVSVSNLYMNKYQSQQFRNKATTNSIATILSFLAGLVTHGYGLIAGGISSCSYLTNASAWKKADNGNGCVELVSTKDDNEPSGSSILFYWSSAPYAAYPPSMATNISIKVN